MRLFLLTLMILAFTGNQAPAQKVAADPTADPTADPGWHFGYEMFQMLLEEQGLIPARSWDAALSLPAESVVVVCGDLHQIHPREWLRVRRFVAQGGALLMASEGSFEFPGVCNFFHGTAVSSDSRDRYLAFADCLRIRRLNPNDELTTGVHEIVVNRTGWLSEPTDDSLDWKVIASMPATTLPRASRNQPLILAGRDASASSGLMILLADESLLTNGMLWHGDNAILAIQVSQILCGGARRHLLFVRDGTPLPGYRESSNMQRQEPKPPQSRPLPDVELPNVELPEPDMQTKLQIANAIIDEVQQSNLVNEVLRDRPRRMRPLAYLRTALLVLLVLATLFTIWRLMQKRVNLPPLPQRRMMQSVFGLMSSRRIANSEFGSAIAVLARDLCIELTGSHLETDWIRSLSERQVAAMTFLSNAQRRDLSEILGIALRGTTIHLTRHRFEALGLAIQQLRGQYQISPIVKSVTEKVEI